MNVRWAVRPTFFIGKNEFRKMYSEHISIRRAKPEDSEAICRIHIASVRELCADYYTLEQIEAWIGKSASENVRKAILERGEIIFVAEIKKTIVGFASLFEQEVRAVYVHPSYARQGIGTLLLNAVEREAVAKQVEKLEVVASTNAKSFYLAQGYKVIEQLFHTLVSGVQIPCIYMEKYLSQTGDANNNFSKV